MIFNSVRYLLFLLIVVFFYYIVPNKFRWIPLLAASYCFCVLWSIDLLIWMIVITALAFGFGLLLERKHNKTVFVISLLTVFSILFVFKYLNFTITQINSLFKVFHLTAPFKRIENLVMPIGISFYTFQAAGYIADVYKGKLKASRHPGKFALYMAFFPHIMQGPIDRSDNLLTQFDEEHRFDYTAFRNGMIMILFGLFKKVVIADRLIVLVDKVFNNVSNYSGQAFWVASVFYTFQIYCDFSAYTDIALGSAELMGFRLVKNFNEPYLATSIADFWHRWHMSLSRWFRDYIYIPLGGSRVSELRWALNVLIVFFISGIWHGADWTFILWGVLHGIFQIIEKYRDKLLKPLENNTFVCVIKTFVTFLIVNYLWILFRANSLSDFVHIFHNIVKIDPKFDILKLGMIKNEMILSCILIVLISLTDILNKKFGLQKILDSLPLVLRWSIYMATIFTIILFGKYGTLTESSFIYFQF